MIESGVLTVITCDECLVTLEVSLEPTWAKEHARSEGWSIGREYHYCPRHRPRAKPSVPHDERRRP